MHRCNFLASTLPATSAVSACLPSNRACFPLTILTVLALSALVWVWIWSSTRCWFFPMVAKLLRKVLSLPLAITWTPIVWSSWALYLALTAMTLIALGTACLRMCKNFCGKALASKSTASGTKIYRAKCVCMKLLLTEFFLLWRSVTVKLLVIVCAKTWKNLWQARPVLNVTVLAWNRKYFPFWLVARIFVKLPTWQYVTVWNSLKICSSPIVNKQLPAKFWKKLWHA